MFVALNPALLQFSIWHISEYIQLQTLKYCLHFTHGIYTVVTFISCWQECW